MLTPLLCCGQADTAVVRILRMPLDSNRVMAFVNLGWGLTSESPANAVKISDLAYTDSRSSKWEIGEVEALLLKAKCYDYLGKYREALPLNFKALEISERLQIQVPVARS